MAPSSARLSPRFGALQVLLGRLQLRPAGAGPLAKRRRNRPYLERLEDRCVPTVSILNGGGNGYAGLGGINPPDTCGAAGPSEYIEVINTQIEIFSNKTSGTPTTTGSLDTFLYTTGGLKIQPTRDGRDSTVLYDNLIGRFIIGDLDADDKGNTSNFNIGVSTSNNPTDLSAANWKFYQITTTETSGSTTNWGDYPGNPGFNADAVVLTFNMAHGNSLTGNSQVVSINASDLANGVAQGSLHVYHNDVAGTTSLRPTSMHDSVSGDPMWLIHNPNDGTHIDVVKMTNVLSSSASFATTSLSLPAADDFSSGNINPLNPDGTSMSDIDTRILKAGEYNNTIVATNKIKVSGTEADVQWYAFDVSSGTPAFQQVGGSDNVGRIGFGSNTYSFDPGIDINSRGQIGLNFQESDTNGGSVDSSTKGYVSMFVTARNSTDAAGTMESSVLVPTGKGFGNISVKDSKGNNVTRVGDFAGTNVDPANGTFWGVNEFGDGGAGTTAIANFTPDIAPTVTPPADQTSVEGASNSFNLGSFADPDGGPWTVDVSWGDSTPDTVFTANAPGTIASQSHTYGEEGSYIVTVKVTDTVEGQSDSKTFNVSVSDPAVVASGVAVSAVEGAAFTGTPVATFTDPGGVEPNSSDPSGTLNNHYKVVSIDWGDSTPLDTTSGAISLLGNTFTVSGNHTYGEEGTYTITAIIDHEGVDTTVQTTATVSDPAVIATSTPVYGVECRTLTVQVATFTDPGGAEPNPSDPSGTIANHYKVDSIDWGDGTPLDTTTGTIAYSGAQGSTTDAFTVSGSHAFQHEGTYTVTTTLDHEGIITVTQTTAIIKDDIGLLLLDPSGSQSLMVNGNGIVDVTGCGAAVVDSTSASAAFLSGNASLTAEDIDVTGGVKTAGHASFSAPIDKEAATPDPLGLSLPAPPTPTFAAVHYSGSAPITLQPGTYLGGIAVSGHASVTLAPGVYYLQGGGFSVSGQASVTGSGVTLINAPAGPSDAIRVSGQASLNLTAPSSGPFQGVTIFQDPASSDSIQFTGQASVTLTGVVYVPDALVQISGNAIVTVNPGAGTATLPPYLGALISYDLKVDGNGILTINPDDPPGGASAAVVLAGSSSIGAGASIASSAALGSSPSISTANNVVLPYLLNGNLQVMSNNPSSVAASPSAASTSTANQPIASQLLASSASLGARSQSSMTTLADSWSEQLVDELFAQ
jgi:hypothetical protein